MTNLERAKKLGYHEGDLVTGVDQSYQRSLYRVMAVNSDGVTLRFVSFGKVLGSDYPPYDRPLGWDDRPGNRPGNQPEDFMKVRA